MRLLYVSDTNRVHDRRFVEGYRGAGMETAALALATVDDPVGHVAEALEGFAPDVIHAGPMTTAAWFAVQAGASPLVSMSWGSDILRDAVHDPSLAKRALEVARHSALVQCDSVAVERVLLKDYGVSPGRITRFPWGIDTTQFAPGARPHFLADRLGVDRDDVVVLSTRNFEPVYDIPTLLSAFSRALNADPRLRLIMLGHGSGEATARAFVAEQGCAEAVTFVGHVENSELPDFFRLADVYLACSLSDGSSVSLLEALATGVPAVVSDIEANREWVEAACNGWLAPVGDACAFSEALVSAAGLDADTRLQMAKRNRKVAEVRADWSVNMPKFVERVMALG